MYNLMLDRCLRWSNINPALDQRLVCAVKVHVLIFKALQ